MIYIRAPGPLIGAREDSTLPVLSYFCYDRVAEHAFRVYEILDIFSDGTCCHSKSWNEHSLTSQLISETEIEESHGVNSGFCSKEEFDAVKSMVLRLCKTNAEFHIAAAHDVSVWDVRE